MHYSWKIPSNIYLCYVATGRCGSRSLRPFVSEWKELTHDLYPPIRGRERRARLASRAHTFCSVFFYFQLLFQVPPRLRVFRAELVLHSTRDGHAASSSPTGRLSLVTSLKAGSVPSQGRAAAPRWHLSSQHREAAGFICFTERIYEERHLRFPALCVTPGTVVGQWTDDGVEGCTLLMRLAGGRDCVLLTETHCL